MPGWSSATPAAPATATRCAPIASPRSATPAPGLFAGLADTREGAGLMARDRGGKGPTVSADEGSLLGTVRNLWSYMWPEDRPDLQLRVILAIGALLASKVATTLVPFAYKGIIDSLDGTTPEGALILGPRGPDRARRRLRRRQHHRRRLPAVARRAVRQRRPERGAQARAPDLPAPPPAVAALPSGAPHRRAEPRHRARHQGHRDHRPLHDAQHRADAGRVRHHRHDLHRDVRRQLPRRSWSS